MRRPPLQILMHRLNRHQRLPSLDYALAREGETGLRFSKDWLMLEGTDCRWFQKLWGQEINANPTEVSVHTKFSSPAAPPSYKKGQRRVSAS